MATDGCRRCSECPDAPHHALLPEPDPHGESEGERWYIPCKHCPAEGWYCAKCNEDDEGDIDPNCDSCGGFGVEWKAEVTIKVLDDGDEKRLPTVEITVPRGAVKYEVAEDQPGDKEAGIVRADVTYTAPGLDTKEKARAVLRSLNACVATETMPRGEESEHLQIIARAIDEAVQDERVRLRGLVFEARNIQRLKFNKVSDSLNTTQGERLHEAAKLHGLDEALDILTREAREP